MSGTVRAVYIRRGRTTADIMRDVLLALTAPLTASVWFFGWRALLLCAVSVLVCVAAEAVCQKLSGRAVTINDLSAVVTGLLLALSVPVTTPVYALAAAAAFSIIIAKQLFGGIGQNIFNPALAGRALLLVTMTSSVFSFITPFDAVATATPLVSPQSYSVGRLLYGARAGSMGETSAVLLLLAFGYLYARGVVRLYAPVGMLGSLAVMSFVFGGDALFTGDAARAVLSGGAMLGALFMATDYSSTPTTAPGRFIFGIGAGVLTFAIRKWSVWEEGVCFAILAMNLFSPMIEQLTEPAVYGNGGTKLYESESKAAA